jgi:enterochelin esterase family protein
MKHPAALLLFLVPVCAQRHPLETLMDAARQHSPALKELLPANIHALKERGGAAVWGQDFLFAIEIATTPTISVDRQAPLSLTRVPGSNLWYRLMRLRLGVTHSYEFFSDGQPMSLMYSYDVAGYNVDSYPRAGVPRGTMSEKRTMASQIYPNMTADFWIYASAGVDPSRPSPVMVWQDGEAMTGAKDLVRMRLAIVVENLVYQKLIPPMIHVLISPGTGPAGAGGAPASMRGVQYSEVSDRYGRYLLEEILPAVAKTYRLRQDGYSRAIGGLSAGGICAFNTAWHFPDQFSRVYSHVGAFTAPSRTSGEDRDGGHLYPFKVRREPRKNLRVWLSSGTYDYENQGGSFPLQNIHLANSLKLRGYDFHFRFGEAMHSGGQPSLDLPEVLPWLWREYDPAKTYQEYEMEEAEKSKPVFRVQIVNRDSW